MWYVIIASWLISYSLCTEIEPPTQKKEKKKELHNGKLIKTGLKAKKWFLLVTDVLVLPLLFFPRISRELERLPNAVDI